MIFIRVLISTVVLVALLALTYRRTRQTPQAHELPFYANTWTIVLVASGLLALLNLAASNWLYAGIDIVVAGTSFWVLGNVLTQAEELRAAHTPEQLQLVLEMADLSVPLCDIEQWTAPHYVAAYAWAVREHDIANDNDLPRIPLPGILNGYLTFTEMRQGQR